jgi:hypothetical protein
MDLMKKVFALMMLSLVACVAEPAVEDDGEGEVEVEPTSAPEVQKSYVAPMPDWNATTAGCFQQWECETCQGIKNRNVLIEYCDNASPRRVHVGPCGQLCY